MNRLFLLLYSTLLFGLFSCSDTGKLNERLKAVGKTDLCKSDSANTYEIYIPSRNISLTKLPMFVIIDPHGSGKSALKKFKQGAKQYPVILVASNLVKNGLVNYEKAIQMLIEDVHQKYPVSFHQRDHKWHSSPSRPPIPAGHYLSRPIPHSAALFLLIAC